MKYALWSINYKSFCHVWVIGVVRSVILCRYMLTAESLHKSFGTTSALIDCNLSVAPGTVLAVLGPNGSGKTVLTQLLAGVLVPDQGTVWVGDVSLQQQPTLAKQRIGYVPGEPLAWPELTGLEFLHYIGALYGLTEQQRQVRINELLARFSMQGIGHTYMHHYSRANQQKLALLAAVLPEPTVLVLDELAIGLDLPSREAAVQLVQEHRERGGSVVLCTHDHDLAETIASVFLFLRDGKIVAHNTLPSLREQSELDPDTPLSFVYKRIVGQPVVTE